MTKQDFHFYRLETSVFTQRKELSPSISKGLTVGILSINQKPHGDKREDDKVREVRRREISMLLPCGEFLLCVCLRAVSKAESKRW